jgi:hypothetical protein
MSSRVDERITTLPRKPNFARYLRDPRTKHGLSVAEVAEQVGVSTALCKVLKLPIKATREMAAG